MVRLALLALVLGTAAPALADAGDLAATPAVRVDPDRPAYVEPLPRRIVHGPITPAMHVWILRGNGPAGPIHALGTLDLEVIGDADAAIDRLQERAYALHADAVLRVRIEHAESGATRVTGLAIRYAR